MDSPRSPLPIGAPVEPPEDAPRAMSGASFYRVNSDSTLEQLQKQMQEKAMASGSMPTSEHLDRIAPDPGPLPMPQRATGATGTESLPIQSRPSMRTLHSALDNEVLGRLVSAAETGSKDEVPLGHDQCRQACIDRLCIILLLPIGVVLHGQPRWVASVRVAAVLMGTVLWTACVYTMITGGNTGWQMGSCLLHVLEATANLILLLQKAFSSSFKELNAHVKDAMRSQNMGPAQKSAIKWHILVITASLACWMICHVAKVRLVAMGGGQMTWQVVALPCLQCLYRAGWVLWLLRLNEFVNELVDAFCRSCASNPEGVDLAYVHWARISAFTGQITEHCQKVYGVMSVTALMGGVAPIAEIFMPTSSPQSTDWMLPQLIASVVVICLTTYAWGSAAMVSEKSKKAASLVNSLQGCLAGHARAEIRRLVGYMESSHSGIFFGGSKVDLRWYSRLRYVTFSASVFLAVRFQSLPEENQALLAEQWGRFLHALAVWDRSTGHHN
ncbi:Rabgap1l [Symbiodinium necroappetens]|uniref:Rabgap1l protein n=1 Tax=Symbiodinium necroappetens TaxID=1628268 RepID=A0A812Z3P4_9DINO|nr:Rabgap1l [Symbiodinium necroappetens]